MFKFVARFALVFGISYALASAVAAFFNAKVTPQKINDQEVDPKLLKWFFMFKGYDSVMCDAWVSLYEDGHLRVDEDGIFTY